MKALALIAAFAASPGVHSVPWHLDGKRQAGSRTVRIVWSIGRGYACEWTFLGATARERRRSVTIRARARYTPREEGTICPAVTPGGPAKVRLDRRLGTRRLLHARVDVR